MQKLVLATANRGKVRELADLLVNFGLDIVGQSELGIPAAPETGLTFIENAILKARHAAQLSKLPALADDSGLAVDVLEGAPGIYSARYAGEQGNDALNTAKLLDALKGVPKSLRTAHFHCVLAYLRHAEDPTPIICHGIWSGEIALQSNGNGGFGYDPVFYIPALHCTAAELSIEQKRTYSHRGQALQQLFAALSHA